MGIASKPPEGGTVAELAGISRQLVLRNGEIERFEELHDKGVFSLTQELIENTAQLRHCRDILALGLVGAGKTALEADRIMSEVPPHESFLVRQAARDLVLAAFTDPSAKKKEQSEE